MNANIGLKSCLHHLQVELEIAKGVAATLKVCAEPFRCNKKLISCLYLADIILVAPACCNSPLSAVSLRWWLQYKAVGELQPSGKREVFFEANGVPRVLEVVDKKAEVRSQANPSDATALT